MKLWGGRFTKETNELVHNFNASLSFDQKFYKQDITGSIAHVNMLAKQEIVTNEERFAIIDGLESILRDIEEGILEISPEYEDIHSFVEATLIEKTVLPEIYRMRAKEVVWYLENLMADNLKEALAALVEADHREQVKHMIEEQNQEINQLKDITAKLMEHNQKLAHKLEQQRQQLVELENRKK